jgi:hypothetical protein
MRPMGHSFGPGDATATQASGSSITAQLFGLEKMPFHEFNDINLNDCWLGAMCPVSAGTGLSQHVDELRNHWSGYPLRLPGGSDRHPRSVLGRQIAKNHILGGYLLQRLADHRHPIPRRDKGERARGAVRFLGESLKPARRQAFKANRRNSGTYDLAR